MSSYNTLTSYLGRLLTVDVLVTFGVLAVITYLSRKRLEKWLALPKWPTLWVSWSLAGILAFTIRIWDSNGFDPLPWFLHLERWNSIYMLNASFLLNVALFIPTGILLTAFGKPLFKSLIGLMFLSTLIELFQQYTKYGIGDPADFVANSGGAMIGLAVGKIIFRLVNVRSNKSNNLGANL